MPELKNAQFLLSQIEAGNVILFLGAGFSRGAKHPQGNASPVGAQLGNMIVSRFLEESYKDYPLNQVAELAISESSLSNVQEYIYDVFSEFEPSLFQNMLPLFKWKSIYTVNYDLIVEKAYQNTPHRLQELSRVFKNTRDYEIFKYDSTLPLYKLHGCISNIRDPDVPLILTPEQYITHRKNRDHLFQKLKTDGYSYPIVFVGFSLADPDIRTILMELDAEVEKRPQYFFIGPSIKDAEVRLWEKKSISPFKLTFDAFITELDKLIPLEKRKLGMLRQPISHPIKGQFYDSSDNLVPSISFTSFIGNDIDYIHAGLTSEVQDAKMFYKGYFENWDPILRNLDVTRELLEIILEEIILQDYYNSDTEGQWVFAITGHAGSGKSVLLRRLAWETGVNFERFVIFYNRLSKIKYENIEELYTYVKRRIYIFIDNAIANESEIQYVLTRSIKAKIPITIITAERTNLLNSDDSIIRNILKNEYQLEYLTRNEIKNLLTLLERHKSLGYLEGKTETERFESFDYRPGYQLLVTLYEATHGAPFTQILKDEFMSIDSGKAQSIYLTVSVLHRLNTSARAGLIARVHGVPSQEFKEELHKPLEYIVFDRYDYRIQDYVYQTRHPDIAELVVSQILDTQEKRFDEYMRIIEYLDVDYSNDRTGFAAITNAKKLLDDFQNRELIRQIYEAAMKNNSDNPKLLQQYAIFAMEIGDMVNADKRIRAADKFSKHSDPSIKHTFAEFEFRKAERTNILVEKRVYLNDAIRLANENAKVQETSPYPFHTILKAYLLLIEIAFGEGDPATIDRAIKEFDKKIVEAKVIFPRQEFILTAEANFNRLLNNTPEAVDLLIEAHEINPGSPYIVSRLVRFLDEQGDRGRVKEVLEKSLKASTNDRELNLMYAEHLLKTTPENTTLINHHLSRSYTMADSRYYPQYLHAKTLYLSGSVDEANKRFRALREAQVSHEVKTRVLDVVLENSIPSVFYGIMKDIKHNHGWILRDKYGDSIFFFDGSSNVNRMLGVNDPVSFNLGFTFGGPTAINIKAKKK